MVGYRLEVPSLSSKPKPSEFPVVSGNIHWSQDFRFWHLPLSWKFLTGWYLGPFDYDRNLVTGILRWNCFNDSSFTGGWIFLTTPKLRMSQNTGIRDPKTTRITSSLQDHKGAWFPGLRTVMQWILKVPQKWISYFKVTLFDIYLFNIADISSAHIENSVWENPNSVWRGRTRCQHFSDHNS